MRDEDWKIRQRVPKQVHFPKKSFYAKNCFGHEI